MSEKNKLEHNVPLRRTKIVATLGPATDDDTVFIQMIKNGLNVVRLNFSHGSHADQIQRIERVRSLAAQCGKPIGILIDLQGPKIRIARFKEDKIQLQPKQAFTIDCELDDNSGTEEAVGVTYKTLYKEVTVGNELLLDDGAISLEVTSIDGKKIHCETLIGGELSNSKGLNLRGGGLSADALTDKDKQDIVVAGEVNADYLAVSFVRHAADVELARKLFRQAGGNGGIVSKVERAEAIVNLDEIIKASDVVMIARGDLGVELGDAELPVVQKKIISEARNNDCVTITATQMMQSMVDSPLPTRAEVLDVANSIIDGTDAVMLSAETAVGKHPDLVIEAMDRICRGAERNRLINKSKYRDDRSFVDAEESVAMASMYVANKLDVVAIVALTESGQTAKLMSRISSGIPIFALSRHDKTIHRVSLYRGVYPLKWVLNTENRHTIDAQIINALRDTMHLSLGDKIVVTQGDQSGIQGQTNTMKIITVN
ncbi:MAG: pyruvate kinase [Arenicella sp.]